MEVDSVVGAFLLIRKSVMEKIGPLDEKFFMYGEDLDWCYRAQVAGWNISYVHATQIIHYKGESTRRSGMTPPPSAGMVRARRITTMASSIVRSSLTSLCSAIGAFMGRPPSVESP